MNLIKINAIPSTNTYLKELRMSTTLSDETVVLASNQTKGRGQHTNSWQSQPANSLTFSIYKLFGNVKLEHQFYVSMAVSLGVYLTLKKLEIPNVKIKWPNDIMAEEKKCCGILIETSIKKSNIKDAIIGIGLNVNESQFENLPKASSLYLTTGKMFDIDVVLKILTSEILKKLHLLQLNELNKLHDQYHSHLYKMGKISVFEDANGLKFNGIIKGVTNNGLLIVETEDSTLLYFGLKEIRLLG
ncbi:biotin--[acetyl-CoA-carboxylase] ligase [Patiriisocius marinistellae]|uniref:Biotin--[acetyl-CoA-carboxylase] ligase n=1 Tax=Patiriisocius marinistellae TaxID=2494560 RepID=A0A5J4G035_9FLAO|nr:biotin--[acetyl-CoA-carboxylase] ligase [Patiriisocius marinistellae]GEQ85685.1 biotin--[acetyl-CoA-carboxylase] ligase [Patiriisocius marinistellae]